MPGLGEHGGLVHVVPDAGHAHVDVGLLELRAPPGARRGLGEVGEHARARVLLALRRPHRRRVHGAVRVLDEGVRGQPALVDRPALPGLGVRIDDGHDLEALRAQLAHHARGIGEAPAVPGERVVAVLVVDVEPEHVGGDALEPEGVGEVAHLRLRIVAVARLVVAERPQRRQRRAADQLGEALHDVSRRGPVDEVVVQRAVHGSEREQVPVLLAGVEPGAERVVEEDAVRAPVPQHHEEGHRDVEGVRVVGVRVRVRVPHRVGVAAPIAPPLVQVARLLAQAVDVLVVAQALPHARGAAGEGHAPARVVLVAGLAVRGREGNA